MHYIVHNKNGTSKLINLLDSTANKAPKCGTKIWVEINNSSPDAYDPADQTKCKTEMLNSKLCDYSNACVLVTGSITVAGNGDVGGVKRADERIKDAIFNNCTSFREFISEINITHTDNAMMPMYSLIEHSDNY